jgi:hypothetical protein
MMRLDYLDQLARMKDADLDALARSKREEWHVNCEWVIGTPGIAPGLGYLTTFDTPKFEKYPPLGDFDLIREYLPHARKYGIHVLAYLNMHWFAYDFADAHPGWEQLMADGTAYGRANPLYGGGTTFCVNGGWRDWARDMAGEAMKTGIDGVFLDGPVVFPGCCYCPACREKFQERFGAEIPPAEDWSDERWKDFVEFREDSMAEFLAYCRSAVKSVNPDGVIFLNAGSWHAGAWRVARDIEKVGDFQEFNGAEAFFHPGPRQHILHFWATAAKHLVAGGKPAVVFSHHALGSWHYIPLPPIETQLAIAQTVACGANPWFAVFDYALDHSRDLALQPVKEIQGFLEENEEYYTETESCAEVALLFSRQTATYYVSALEDIYGEAGTGAERDLIADVGTGERIVDWRKRKQLCDDICGHSYLGYFTALTREHIQFDVILDKDLTPEFLSRYKVLILPNSACLSDSQAAAVREYVESGGGLIAEFETGEYDERGRRRASNPLADVLGVSKIERAMPPAAGEEYVKVKSGHPAVGSFGIGQLIARPQLSLEVEKTSQAEAPVVFMNRIGRLYAGLAGESDAPALIAHEFGKGRVAYLPALVGDFYARFKMHEYQLLIASTVRWACASPLCMEVEAPATVEVELRRQADPDRLIVHLVNNTGDMQRPISEIIPVRDVRIRLRGGSASQVRSLRTGPLSFTSDEHRLEFTIPELRLYEVVVVG